MAILDQVQQAFQYVLEGASRIFGLDDNRYPETGVQPFEGEPYNARKQENEVL
ncbi:MAG: isochorismate synthase [Elainellaceae cyanobacterium]